MVSSTTRTHDRLFVTLIAGFAGQIAGRLLDFRWHSTHSEFEGGEEQLEAHWLIWAATILVIVCAAVGVRDRPDRAERLRYAVVLWANVAYAAVAIVHFFQHLNHLEVDWAHFLLGLTNVVGAAGVVSLIGLRLTKHRSADSA